jgi:hypothetical protein
MQFRRTIPLLPALALLFGCGASSEPKDPTTSLIPTVAGSSSQGFANPGGMWMPRQLLAHKETLSKLGLEMPIEQLSNPLEHPLGAIVSLGGCSASFVSPDGLIATNHHCVQGALQYHSNPEKNYVYDGFYAKTRADEKWNGPSAKVWVTESIDNVTDKVLGGLEKISDDKARYDEIEKREKQLIAECEKDSPYTRCRVANYFRGAEYHLIHMLELKDIRLVYAPQKDVGQYGGDIDNWMWPRHGGDFSFYRAYVGPDGKPAEYNKANVPYQPKHHLKVASKPLREGDLVMVAGYPGRTYRHKTADEVRDAVEYTYPRNLERYQELLQVLRAVGEKDADAKIKAQPFIMGIQNAQKNNRGMLDGLVKGELAKDKDKLEAKLRQWIEADPARKQKYGTVLDDLKKLDEEARKHRVRDSGVSGLRYSSLLGTASTIVRMAEERPKADADRDPGYQERQWKRTASSFESMDRRYNRNLDKALFAMAIERAMREQENADWLKQLFGKEKLERKEIDARIEAMYGKTRLENAKTRIQLYQKATTAQLKKSRDPFIQMALKLRPIYQEIEDRDERIEGAMSLLKPLYIEALREHSTGPLAPDANSTLRVTFGTVRGYKPANGSEEYTPFTKLSQVIAKHTGEEPFNLPENFRAAYEAKKFGPYVDEKLGEVPVNFLTDLDTTGGNSGSATLNARGELVGLIFDGNYEAMASDYIFMPDVTRSIHCDIRYAFWIMDAVDGADRLLEEMGVKPSI